MEREIEARFERTEAIVTSIAESTLANTEAITQLIGTVNRLAEAQLETTGKLDAVAHMMDLWIRERGEGGAKQ
jgi:hypothetical protein